MKKILLGTTLLSAAVFAQAALAETPKITVGGVSDFQFGYVDQDGDNTQRHHGFRSDNEISFKVDGKTAGGLGYGAEVWLEADTTDDADSQGINASKTFIYLDGMWGRFEMGSNLGVTQTMKIGAESIARATGGIDGDWYYFVNTTTTAALGQMIATPDLLLNYGTGTFGNESTENNNKITYYSPRFSGFQVGASYVVDILNERGQTASLNTEDANDAQNILSLAANWEGKWDAVSLGFAATMETGGSERASEEDLFAWNFGGRLGYMGFSLAASYGDWNDSLRTAGSNLDDSWYWTLGGAYETGPYGFSVTYFNSQYSQTSTTENEFDNLSFGADYKMAPGLTPYAEVSIFDADSAGAGGDNDGWVFLLGTQLNY